MDRREKAQKLFLSGYNCSQAVAIAFSDLVGIDEQTMCRLSSTFGGGFGRLREICGAVSGAGIILGLLYYDNNPNNKKAKAEHYKRVQEFAKAFKEINGSYICGELLDGKINVNKDPNPDERNAEYFKIRPCVKMVDDAVKLLNEYIENHPYN